MTRLAACLQSLPNLAPDMSNLQEVFNDCQKQPKHLRAEVMFASIGGQHRCQDLREPFKYHRSALDMQRSFFVALDNARRRYSFSMGADPVRAHM